VSDDEAKLQEDTSTAKAEASQCSVVQSDQQDNAPSFELQSDESEEATSYRISSDANQAVQTDEANLQNDQKQLQTDEREAGL